MKTLKILSIFVFAIFLVSTVSAFGYIEGAFDDGSMDGSQSITITEGDSINFNYDFISDSSPMTININLHDSSTGEIVIPFVTNQPVTTPCSGLPSWVCYTGQEIIPSNINPGNYELIMFADNIGDSKTLYLTINAIPDITAPIIYLKGYSQITLEIGESYSELGAYAVDDIDGTWDLISENIDSSSVDTEVVGVYTVTYNVQDNAGNNATEVTRTVNVFDPNDVTAPVIHLRGNSQITLEIGESYSELGAYAVDDIDGTWDLISENIDSSSVDTEVVGVYTVTYNVQDNAGNNATEVTRTVNVFDPNDVTAPVITPEDKDNKLTNYYQSNYDEELYLDQFNQKKIVHLEEDVQPIDELTIWQKFIAWLKKVFGFN